MNQIKNYPILTKGIHKVYICNAKLKVKQIMKDGGEKKEKNTQN